MDNNNNVVEIILFCFSNTTPMRRKVLYASILYYHESFARSWCWSYVIHIFKVLFNIKILFHILRSNQPDAIELEAPFSYIKCLPTIKLMIVSGIVKKRKLEKRFCSPSFSFSITEGNYLRQLSGDNGIRKPHTVWPCSAATFH